MCVIKKILILSFFEHIIEKRHGVNLSRDESLVRDAAFLHEPGRAQVAGALGYCPLLAGQVLGLR